MCGIVGILGNGSEKELNAMLRVIKHRGPDADDTYLDTDRDVYLGHARLSVLDIAERSNQPLWDDNSKACIVFNGEIYNYKQLRAKLIEEKNVKFKTDGDAEVILNLYLHGYQDWLTQLNGMFAFAIWEPSINKTTIARDGFGVKPLYYYSSIDTFSFSSEIKSFFCLDSFNDSIDYDAIFRTITFLWNPGPSTILSEVKKLEPGYVIEVENSKIVKKNCFWEWPKYSPNSETSDENVFRVQTLLEQSVKRQMLSDVEIGAFLSGGVDSSSIVAIANNLSNPDSISCFTIESLNKSNNDGFADDLPFAKKVANTLNCPLHIVKVTPDICNDLYKMIYHLDEPQADVAPLNVLYICNYARKNNIKVLLSGAGGDDVYSGYRRHLAIKLENYWKFLPIPIRTVMQYFSKKVSIDSPTMRRISKAFRYASLDDDDRILSYFYWLPPERVHSLFSKKVQAKLSQNPLSDILNDLKSQKIEDPIEKMLYLERKHFLVDHNFNYTDKMSMASGVEVRVPFLDRDLVEHATTIPSNLKVKANKAKWILKKSAEKYLDDDILYRSKSGFGAPLRTWLMNDLKEFVDEILGRESIEKRNIFNYEEVYKLIQDDRNGVDDYSYPIFSLICIEIWFRIFIDKEYSYSNF